MLVHEPVAARATALLAAIREGDQDAASEYYALLFPVLFEQAKRRGRLLASRIPGGSTLPSIRPADLEDVASRAAEFAVERARGNAHRFDPSRGDGASWALGALPAAYLDAARSVTGDRRVGAGAEILVDDLAEQVDRQGPPLAVTSDPETIVIARDELDRALAELTEDERYVVIAKLHFGLSYAEIALYRFHDAQRTKQVDHLLQSARRKLEAAERRWREE